MTIESDEAYLAYIATKFEHGSKEVWNAALEYQRKVDAVEIEKLRALLLLVDPAVSDVEMNAVTQRQWCEYTRVYPQEPTDKYELIRTSDGDYA